MAALTTNLFHGHGGDHADNQASFDLTVVEGRWPADMDGQVVIVGPDRRAPDRHWFAGQALLTRIRCRPDRAGRIRVDSRRVETPLDRIRAGLPHLFRTSGVLEVSPFGYSNFGNTNVQWLGDRLFLGYDGGRPIEVDVETLDFLTPVGRNEEWLQTLPASVEPLIAVAAHPGPDFEEQALYFANYELIALTPERAIRICRWGLEGEVQHWRLEGVSAFDSIHDVKVTRDHVVVMDLPFVMEPMGPTPGLPRRAVQDFARLWIVRKADLSALPSGSAIPYREISVPMMGGHLSVAYENEGDEIVVYVDHHPMTDLGLGLHAGEPSFGGGPPIPEAYEGLFPVTVQPSGFARHVIDVKSGRVVDQCYSPCHEALFGALLFTQNSYDSQARAHPRSAWKTSMGFHPQLVPERWWQTYSEVHENVFVAPRDFPRESLPGALVRIDLQQMEVADFYSFPEDRFGHPPTFVPRNEGADQDDGYIVVLVHADGDKELQVFDALDVAAGPLARASAPGFCPPLPLHSSWMPERDGARPSDYRVDPERDAWETLGSFAERGGATVGIGRALAGSQ